MKRIFTLVFLGFALYASAQNAVGAKVSELIAQQTRFEPVSVFTENAGIENADTRKALTKATYAKLQNAPLAAIMASKPQFIELSIPYQGQIIQTQLYAVNILAEGFHVDTDKATSVAYNPGLYYRGIIKGQPQSLVSFNFFNDEVSGILSGKNLYNVVVGKLDKAGNQSDYVIYSDRDLTSQNGFSCQTKETALEGRSISNRAPQGVAPRCVTMYLELDYNLYQASNNSVATANNWATAVFNNVQTLYANDNITIALKSTFVWTTDDPYEGESSSDYLYQFNNLRPAFDGDLGQLLGIDPGGLGGVAVTIDGLCSQNNFSYSDLNYSYNTVPTFSWTVMVITHEFGHLMGSPHTHACVWNGNNTAIDNCGSAYEGEECVTTPPTYPEEGGTIMSYCHLQDVGINFNFGFGLQPRNAILSAMASADCLSSDCISTCINAVANVQIQVTNGSMTATWSELGSATSWQVAVTPFASNSPTWTTVTSPSYTTSGLNANTFYRLWVRPVCANGLTAPNDRTVFATSATWCNGIQITDTGGVNGNYTNNQDYTRVLIPNLANNKIKLTFSAFDLEADYDFLYVYDGNSTAAPELGVFDGTDIPGPFESTATDGSLTLRFYADGGVTESGFVAQVSCVETLANSQFGAITDFTYFPNPTTGQVNIQSKTAINQVQVYNVTGQLLHDQTLNVNDAKIDLSNYATGTYFFKLKIGEQVAHFKIRKN